MRCPWCGNPDDRVVDSRTAEGGLAIRRRRECLRCSRRFTTFERVVEVGVSVVKRDGAKEPFDRGKIVAGVTKAIKNRPVTPEQVEALAARTEERLRRKGPLVTSVYKDFQELTDFERELGILLQKREPRRPAGAVSARRTRTRNKA